MTNTSEEGRRILLAERTVAAVVSVEGFLPTLRYIKAGYDKRMSLEHAKPEDIKIRAMLAEFIRHVETEFGLLPTPQEE